MIFGVDIGQTNIKITCLKKNKSLKARSLSFPFQEKGDMIEKLVTSVTDPDLVVVAQTLCFNRELFSSAKEGTFYSIDVVETLFGEKARYVGLPSTLYSSKEAKKQYLKVAGRTWVGTCYLASHINGMENGLVADCGTYSTDIVPVLDSRPITLHEHDLGYTRSETGELLWSGLYFTHVPSLSQVVVLDGEEFQVNPSTQAMSFDIYVILGTVSPEDVLSKFSFLEDVSLISLESAVKRMLDVIAADKELLTVNDAKKIAQFLAEKQLEKTERAIRKVLSASQKYGIDAKTVAIAGAGKDIILRKALENTPVEEILDIEKAASNLMDVEDSQKNCETSLGCALMGYHAYDNKFKL